MMPSTIIQDSSRRESRKSLPTESGVPSRKEPVPTFSSTSCRQVSPPAFLTRRFQNELHHPHSPRQAHQKDQEELSYDIILFNIHESKIARISPASTSLAECTPLYLHPCLFLSSPSSPRNLTRSGPTKYFKLPLPTTLKILDRLLLKICTPGCGESNHNYYPPSDFYLSNNHLSILQEPS